MSEKNSGNSLSSILSGLYMIIIVVAIFFLCCGGGSSSSHRSSYDTDLHNGVDKFFNGRANEMTEGERQATEDFLEWREDHGY